MKQKIENLYRFDSLSSYNFRQRFLIRLADLTFYTLIKIIGRTISFENSGWENFERIATDKKVPIYAFWHERIFLSTYFFRNRNIIVITSQSFDGEYIARFIQRLGYGAVRGSSTRGGVGALAQMIRLMKQNLSMGFTLDGPKGPRHVAKTGAIMLAKKTGNPVMPFVIEAEEYWTLQSWDKLQIPKPFSRAKIFIGELVYVAPDADPEEIENKRRELQKSLDELVENGKQWRTSL
ncbi:MAG: lysophospholipid acyltransferase family protein [Pyrinomonadaceae bacterium]